MKFLPTTALVFLVITLSSPTMAIDDNTWQDISNVGVISLVGSALLLPAVRSDWAGARQAAYSIGSATVAAQIGKSLVHEQRPDNSDNNSFPSGHTANAFASATTLYRRYGWHTGIPAYAVATLTGIARERARKHHWYDVVAGAAIGGATGWFFTDPYNDKIQLTPWVDSDGGGVSVSMRW